ncbi:hypothetical protein DL93DRAFT_123616 [Clavulina sp. PMI_390]|nr:hypothetical protein DL93DRAFT_123616 [Clavulina sp. PMI_390]
MPSQPPAQPGAFGSNNYLITKALPMSTTRLPEEILGEIFVLVTQTARERIDGRLAADQLIRSLFAIASVDSYWRAVATSRTSLWTMIHLSSSRPALGSAFGILKLFLERSFPSSIDIYFALADRWHEYSWILWNSLSPHLGRCRKLIINRLVPGLAEFILPLRQPLERLELFHLDAPFKGNPFIREAASEEPHDAFTQLECTFPIQSEAPMLKELHLIGHAPFWKFDWGLLQSHLRNFPNLCIAVLRFSVSNAERGMCPSEPLALPSLHTLASAKWDPGKYVLLPQLKHFISIDWQTGDLGDVAAHFPSLERLSLARSQTYRLVVQLSITPMLSLKQLDLVRSAAVEELLKYLAWDADRGRKAVFPNLRTLTFYECILLESKISESLEATVSLLYACPTLHIFWDQYPPKWNLAEVPESCRGRLSETAETFPWGWVI